MNRQRWDIEGYDFFHCNIEDHPGMVMVDLELATRAPIAGYQYFHYLEHPLLIATESGMPALEEVAAIDGIEQCGVAQMERLLGAVYVGRRTYNSRRDLCFYAKTSEASKPVLDALSHAFPPYGFSASVVHDPEWQIYFDHFYPGEQEYHYILTTRVLEDAPPDAPAQLGTAEIIHYLYADDAVAWEQGARILQQLGLTVLPEPSIASEVDFARLRVVQQDEVLRVNIYTFALRLLIEMQQLPVSYSHWDIDHPAFSYQALPKAIKHRVAVEVKAGLRSDYWLPRYGITFGKPISGSKAKGLLLKLLGLEKRD